MASLRIFFALVIIIIVVGALAFLGLGSNLIFPVSRCIAEEPDLSMILNKSGDYSFSYINADGQRIAAIDESGHKYFYIYEAENGLKEILEQSNQPIWQSKCP